MKYYWLLITLLLVSCQDRFRYDCQDPTHWEDAECKPPLCTVTETCPNMLIRNFDNVVKKPNQ